MKNMFCIAALVAILNANAVFAASNAGVGGEGLGLIGWIFIGFMAVIITFQLIPAMMMFRSILVAILGRVGNDERVTAHGEADKT